MRRCLESLNASRYVASFLRQANFCSECHSGRVISTGEKTVGFAPAGGCACIPASTLGRGMPDINQVFAIILGVAVMLLLVWPVAGRPKHKRPKDERTLRQTLDVFATWFVRVVGALILIGLFTLWASTVLDEKWKEYWPESYYQS